LLEIYFTQLFAVLTPTYTFDSKTRIMIETASFKNLLFLQNLAFEARKLQLDLHIWTAMAREMKFHANMTLLVAELGIPTVFR